MARLFDDAQSQYLQISSTPVTDEPFTLAAWAYSDDLTSGQTVISIADKDASTSYHALKLRGDESGDPLQAYSYDGSDSKAETSAGYSANTWHHVCGVFASDIDRRAFLDGGNKATNTTSRVVINVDNIVIGSTADSTPIRYMSGRVAEAAIWNVALTDAEVAILGKGYSPLFVRPQNLVAYWPLIRDEDQDRVGGYDLTAFNAPSIASHPPMLYPAPPIFAFGTAAAPPVGQPLMLRAATVPRLRQWQPGAFR